MWNLVKFEHMVGDLRFFVEFVGVGVWVLEELVAEGFAATGVAVFIVHLILIILTIDLKDDGGYHFFVLFFLDFLD